MTIFNIIRSYSLIMRMPEKLEVLNFSSDFSYYIKASNLLPIQYLLATLCPVNSCLPTAGEIILISGRFG